MSVQLTKPWWRHGKKAPIMDRIKQVKVIQANLGRSKLASSEIIERAHEAKVPILLLQEPYTYNNQVASLGKYTNCIINGNQPNEIPWATIVVLDTDYTAVLLQNVSTSHCVCAHITGPTGAFYAISLYCQFSMRTDDFMNQLDNALHVVGNNPVLIGMDANAVSPMWCWRTELSTDDRAEPIEELMTRRNLIAINRPHQPCTFTRGSRDIDVTLADDRTAIKVSNWEVKADWISSDHRPIIITLNDEVTLQKIRERRYNVARADWRAYRRRIEWEMEHCRIQQIHTKDDIDNLVNWMTKAMHKAAKATIPRKNRFQKSVPWWTGELTELKKDMNLLRRIYQEERDPETRRHKRDEYRAARRSYTRVIQETRHKSLVNFVEESSKKNPYGFVYKMLSEKMGINKALTSINTDQGHTKNWNETAHALLQGFFGTNTAQGTENDQVNGREIPTNRIQENWTQDLVEEAISSMKNGKAPGCDMLETEMIKHASKAGMITAMTTLFNGCRRLGYFPKSWKVGVIRILLKSEDKDPAEVKSYRPICLLPILSKVLERLVRYTIAGKITHPDFASDRQYGYRTARSTEDAIVEAFKIVKNSDKAMVLALLFDVTGAFDHLRWQTIITELRRRHTPADMCELISSYLDDRKVTLIDNYQSATQQLHQGCPQGSILGPDFWNICLDPLLNHLTSMGAKIVAYADDLILLVEGNSRRDLEVTAQTFVDVIHEWAQDQGLTLSKTKTEMILLSDLSHATGGRAKTVDPKNSKKRLQARGNMGRSLVNTGKGGKRPPTIKIEGKGIKYSETVKYLGLTIGTRLTIAQHVQNVGTKAKRLFQKMAVFTRANWGLRFRCLKVLYEGVFVPIILYAAGAWGDKVGITLGNTLNRHQRVALLRMARAYRTVSTEALQILTASIPLNLLLQERQRLYEAKKLRENVGELESHETMKEVRDSLRNETLEKWNHQWTASQNGRHTFEFFPTVQDRMQKDWLTPDYYTTQLLTGHGDFKYYLNRFGIKADESCTCGQSDTAAHILLDCEQYAEPRRVLKEHMELKGDTWPPTTMHKIIDTKEDYDRFAVFCRTALDMKKQEEERVRAEAEIDT